MSLADDFEKHAKEEKARLDQKFQQDAADKAKKEAERAKEQAKEAQAAAQNSGS